MLNDTTELIIDEEPINDIAKETTEKQIIKEPINTCLVCLSQMKGEFCYVCECGTGVCSPCGSKINKEIRELYDNTNCEYCFKNYTDFCSKCKNRWKSQCDWIQSLYSKPLKSTNIKAHMSRMEYFQKEYGVESPDDLTPELVAGTFTTRCECNPLCECNIKSREIIKAKYAIALSLYEVYDEATDYCIIKCVDCAKEEGYDINRGSIQL